MNKARAVLLINLPSESVRTPEEHCGLAVLHAYLNRRDIKTDILDSYALRLTLDECRNRIAEWLQSNNDVSCVVGFSPFVTSHESFINLIDYIKTKKSECKIIAGGHYASLNKEYLLKEIEGLDAIIVGEGEISTYEYVLNLGQGNIKGIYSRDSQFITRERITNLDELPFQTRYLSPDELEGQPFAISTSRGCYGSCSFCSISSFYDLNTKRIKQSFRSAKSVGDEIKGLVEKHDIHHLKIIDDNFFRGKDNQFLVDLINELEGVNISFRLSARPNDITEERGILLKRLGVSVIGIGVESAHEESLKLFNKGIKIKDSESAVDILNRNGITCLANFIMFNPIIDLDGVKASCEFVKKNANKCIFHRINSHLWIRSTDPLVNDLVDLGLCHRKGFPYVECDYKYDVIVKIRELFDRWCNHNMKEYYRYADVLMAKGIEGSEEIYNEYVKLLKKDVDILSNLIELSYDGKLYTDGEGFIENVLKEA